MAVVVVPVSEPATDEFTRTSRTRSGCTLDGTAQVSVNWILPSLEYLTV